MFYNDFESLKNDENKYLMQTYGRSEVAFVKGENAILWDINGKEYIDLSSGIGCCSLGYNNKSLLNALTSQAQKLWHISNIFYTEPMVEVAKKLCDNSHFKRVFFTNSGAESNEGAIKIARKYATDKNKKTNILTLNQSFHGRTITTLSATGQDKLHKNFYPFTEGFSHTNANDTDAFLNAIDENTCAVIIELIQGEGGVIPLEKDFVKAVEKVCIEKDILFIVDEIQTGIGRTGKLFCFENFDVSPNIITLAKGLGGGIPIGAILADEKGCDVLDKGSHGTTFGGNPLSLACASTVIDEVLKEGFLDEVVKKGEYLRTKILGFNSENIKGLKGIGLMIGIAVEEGKQANFAKALLEKGVVVLTAGSDTVRLLPPLTITYEELDKSINIMKEVF